MSPRYIATTASGMRKSAGKKSFESSGTSRRARVNQPEAWALVATVLQVEAEPEHAADGGVDHATPQVLLVRALPQTPRSRRRGR
jgi:hypothetical protein